MIPFFIVVDVLLAALSLQSLLVVRARAPWTAAGWAGTLAYAIAAIAQFSSPAVHRPASALAYALLVLLALAFVVAGVRDEPQAEPWYWPRFVGKTRAEKQR